MKVYNDRTVVLAIAPDMCFYQCFVKELEILGYKVTLLLGFSERLISKKDKKINSFLKFFSSKLKEKRLYKLHEKHDVDNLNKLISTSNHSKGLVVRPDLFSDFLLEEIKSCVSKLVAYQWDGIKRYNNIERKISFFDKFYVFDKSDEDAHKGIIHSFNFYFANITTTLKNNKQEYDVYYLGSYDNRIDDVIKLCTVLYKMGLKLNIKIPCSKKTASKLSKYSFIDTTKKKYTYLENLEMASKSKVILDFGHKNLHQGLSFRAFEAIGLSKGLMTTNAEIYKLNINGYLYLSNTKGAENQIKEYIQSNKVLNESNEDYSFSAWFDNIYL